jgi:cell division septation protein DedD
VIRANRGARIRLAGNQTTPRRILRKLDAEGIEDFLSRASGRDEEQKTNITGDNQETKHTMRTKDKAKKTNEASGDKALKLPSKVGRTARVDYLVSKTKKTDSEILKIIQDEFPGGSPKQVSGIIAGKRGKTSNDKPAQKAVKTTRTAKAVKKPAKKVAANARPVRKTKPAPSVPPPRPPAPPVEEQAGLELK